MSDLSLQGFLAECEREQLQRAQSIQPFGALLGGEVGDPRVGFASANLAEWLDLTPEAVMGRPLTELLTDFPPPPTELAEITAAADAWMRPASDKRLYRDLCAGPRGSLDGLLSCNQQNWLLEFEPALPASLRHTAYQPVPHRLYRMPYTEGDWVRHCQYLADEMRAASGCERVMIYRFRDDGCGEVISESLADGLPPYLGLRYPASDIPQIARTLYLGNRHRQIPDIAAPPVPIVSAGAALADLSLSDLRAVSPVHLEYLKNMGVTASLSFSLVIKGRLWGLVACHHGEPRPLPLAVRERCADMAQIFTLAIAGYQSSRGLLEVSESDQDIARLLEALREAGGRRGAGVSRAAGEALLALVRATGAALVDHARIVTFGDTPGLAAIRAQFDWLHANVSEQVFATDALGTLFPPAADCSANASGLLAVRVSRFDDGSERGFLWWRPEQPQNVYWAGDPRKSALFDAQRQMLTPRSSFERWIETTSGHSEPWSNLDLLRAKKFRSMILQDINADLLR